jgi:hypothetical protein
LAEHDTVGGFLGTSFSVKFAEALASPFFFAFGSVIVVVTVQFPATAPLVSMVAVVSLPVIFPHVLVQL